MKESIEEMFPVWSDEPDDPQLVRLVEDIHAGRYVKGFWEVQRDEQGKGNEKKKKKKTKGVSSEAEPSTKKQKKEAAETRKGSSEEEAVLDKATLTNLVSALQNISAKFDAYDFDRNRPVMDEKTLDNVVKAVVQQSLKVLGERKIPDNDAKLSSAGVEKSLSVTSSPRRRSPPEKSDKSPVVEPQAQEEKSVKTPVTEPRQQKKPVKSPEPPQQKEKAVKSPVPPQRKEKAVKSPVPAQQKQQKSVKSPALAETPAKKNSELEKDTVVRRILGDDFNEIDFISVSPAKITKDAKDGKDANVPAYGRGLRGKAKRTVTVKDEAIEDKKKAQRAEAALKRKEKQEAKKKENEEKKQKRKAAELQKKQEAGLQKKKKEDEAELPKKKKEKEAELPKKKKEEEAELQRSEECVVTNDEVLAEDNALAAESDVEPAELIRSSVIKELREKSVKLSPQGFSLTNLDSAPVFPYIGDNGQTTCMRKNITPSSVIYDPCAPVDPARLEKLKQHIKAIPPKPPAPKDKPEEPSADHESDFYSILMHERPWPDKEYGWVFDNVSLY